MRTTRTTVAAVLAAAGLFGAGCSGTSESAPTTEEQQSAGLKNFNACKVLKPDELQAHGLPLKGEPVDEGIGEVGCEYENDELLLGILKAEDSDRAYWEERRNNFDAFVPNQVGSHQGIRGIGTGFVGQGACRQIVFSGGGSVIADIAFSSSQMAGKDPCAKAMEFAELIEPKLPE